MCVYPGYVQSPGWNGHKIYLQSLAGNRVTVKVPPEHGVMFSFKYVRMTGTAVGSCTCRPWGVSVQRVGNLRISTIYACEFISLPPILGHCTKMDVSVMDLYSAGDCIAGEYVNVSSLIVFRLPMIGTGVMSRKIESGDGRGREQLNNNETEWERERVKGDLKRTSEGGGVGVWGVWG